MAEPEENLVLCEGFERQKLWREAQSKTIERSRPWTRDEVHGYIQKNCGGITSITQVLKKDYDALMTVFAGEPIIVAPEISDEEIPDFGPDSS